VACGLHGEDGNCIHFTSEKLKKIFHLGEVSMYGKLIQ